MKKQVGNNSAIFINPESPEPTTNGFKQVAVVLPVSHNCK